MGRPSKYRCSAAVGRHHRRFGSACRRLLAAELQRVAEERRGERFGGSFVVPVAEESSWVHLDQESSIEEWKVRRSRCPCWEAVATHHRQFGSGHHHRERVAEVAQRAVEALVADWRQSYFVPLVVGSSWARLVQESSKAKEMDHPSRCRCSEVAARLLRSFGSALHPQEELQLAEGQGHPVGGFGASVVVGSSSAGLGQESSKGETRDRPHHHSRSELAVGSQEETSATRQPGYFADHLRHSALVCCD